MIADDELLQLAVQGDRSALDQLLLRHGPTVRRRLSRQIDPRWQALLSPDDVLQQTCLDAWEFIRDFEPRGIDAFIAWLTNLGRRNLIDAVRELQAAKRGGDRVRSMENAASNDSYIDLLERIGAAVTSPSQAAIEAETKLAVEGALSQIPELYNRPIRLYDLACQPADDVARACACSVGAMHMRRSRGLALMQKVLRSKSRFLD